jgi:hypothetical protein
MVPGYSPGPGPRPLSAEFAAQLRDAIRRDSASRAAPNPAAPDEALLREAVALVVAEARARDMRPEELIPAFKALLDSLPELQPVAGRPEESKLRERLVTLCIKEYYGV